MLRVNVPIHLLSGPVETVVRSDGYSPSGHWELFKGKKLKSLIKQHSKEIFNLTVEEKMRATEALKHALDLVNKTEDENDCILNKIDASNSILLSKLTLLSSLNFLIAS
jgi:hypothetical protein